MANHRMLNRLKHFVKTPLKALQENRIKKLEASNAQFAIDSNLLGDPNKLAWSNLGFWQTTSGQNTLAQTHIAQNSIAPSNTDQTNDYITACQQLADLVGSAAQLSSTDKLLDLGCGQGASLQYWSAAFAVKHITAFEIQSACIAHIKQAALPQLDNIYQASFSQLPLPAAHLEHTFDAVICVDAAYHAPLIDFLAVNQAALKPQGRIAFTTLIRPRHSVQTSRISNTLKRYLLTLVYIPQQHLNTEIEVTDALSSFGFTDICIQHLDNGVLNGFAQYIKRQPPQLSINNLAAWLKIKLTAKLCAFLYQHQLVHYSVVSARYQPDLT